MAHSFHIIGDPDTIVGYRFAGVTGTAVSTEDEARAAFERITREARSGILLLTAPVAEMLGNAVARHRAAAKPPYVVIVGDIWNTPAKRPRLVDMIHQAVGIRITQAREGEDENGEP